MNGMKKPYAILIFGAPGSGKTRFGEQFGARFKCPFLDFGRYGLNYADAAEITEQVALCGQNFVIEGHFDTEKQRNDIRKRLLKLGYHTALVWVQVDVATIRQRLVRKHKSAEKAKTAFEERHEKMKAPADAENPIVISGKHTFATQLKVVLAKLSKNQA